MATPTIYRSSDTSAPVLTGQVGSLVALLDACLVNGYGARAAAGWTKPFSGTNAASYLSGGTPQFYLDVNDNGASTVVEADVRGYEAMTAVGTGTNPFPTVAQQAAPGLVIRKSATADTTSRGWVLVADNQTFHLFILTGDTANRYMCYSFGLFYSMKTGDAYRCIILAHTSGGVNATGLDNNALAAGVSSTFTGSYVPRVMAGTGTAVNAPLLGVATSLLVLPANGPNAADGNIYLSRLFISSNAGLDGIRGYMRGLYQIITAVGLNDGDTFTGTGDFAGRTFLVLNRGSSGTYFAIETSAWDSST